jgi:hypothetical protein
MVALHRTQNFVCFLGHKYNFKLWNSVAAHKAGVLLTVGFMGGGRTKGTVGIL